MRFSLLALFLLATVGCVQTSRLPAQPRTTTARAATTVRIVSSCGNWSPRTGAGVIISNRHVLTSAYIVACARIPRVHATYTDGTGEHRLRVVVTDEDRSSGIARLEIASAESFAHERPPIVRLPDPGDRVCANLVGGKQPIACGTVASKWTVVKQLAITSVDVGSPVYGERGALVGIVIGGGASRHGPHAWIAPINEHWVDAALPASPASQRSVVSVRMP